MLGLMPGWDLELTITFILEILACHPKKLVHVNLPLHVNFARKDDQVEKQLRVGLQDFSESTTGGIPFLLKIKFQE